MNLQQYQLKRAQLLSQAPKYRTLCSKCIQPDYACYCAQVQTFDSKINFVILIHPVEAKRRIATGRMSYLCLKDSYLVKGQDYSQNNLVNELIQDTQYHSIILYPGPTSKNLSYISEPEKENLFPQNKKLRVFVIDGTWATARKMIRQSENLKVLPRICFTPPQPSNFRVRKQPNSNCFSTIEAIHHTIELLSESQEFNIQDRTHDRLLNVFDYLVERQLAFIKEANLNLRIASYRREGQRKMG